MDLARTIFDRVSLVELSQEKLRPALRPLPIPVRTLDALHLATMISLRDINGFPAALASYDKRLIAAATALDFTIADLSIDEAGPSGEI